MYVVLSIFAIILLFILGMLAVIVKNTSAAVAAEVLARLIAAVTLFTGALLIIPQFKSEFESFGLELSAAARLLVSLSDATVRYWYILGLATALLLAADFCLMFLLHRKPESRVYARLFSGFVSLMILFALVLAVATFGQSVLALRQSLA